MNSFMKLAGSSILLFVIPLEKDAVEPFEILMAESFFSMSINQNYQNESRRLLELCDGVYNSACFRQKMNQFEWEMADVSDSPDANGSIIGEIIAYLYVGPGEYSGLSIGLGFKQMGKEDYVDWIRRPTWGYGINHYILRHIDNWVQLPPNPFPNSAWIQTDNQNFNSRVYSIKDMLMVLPEVSATNTDNHERQQLPPGNYLIIDVTANHVVVRPEIPSDMPCEEEIINPSPLPPTFEIDREEMFDSQNKPRFFVAYPRGC